jgi:hypothetical protein
MLPAAFAPFIQQRPVGVLARAILERFLDPQHLDALFRDTAERQYERHLLFSALVELMQSVILGVEPSVLAAYRKRRPALPVSDDAIYNKLKGMELGVCAALVRDAAQRAAAVIDELGARRAPWLPGYRVRVLEATTWRPPSTARRRCAGPGPRPCRAASWSCSTPNWARRSTPS